MKKESLFLSALILTVLYIANIQARDLEDIPEPPELPDPIETGKKIEPSITILHKQDATIEEYRLNNVLYMVKVTPIKGASYYLIDKDGDGSLETKKHELDSPVIPQWILFSW